MQKSSLSSPQQKSPQRSSPLDSSLPNPTTQTQIEASKNQNLSPWLRVVNDVVPFYRKYREFNVLSDEDILLQHAKQASSIAKSFFWSLLIVSAIFIGLSFWSHRLQLSIDDLYSENQDLRGELAERSDLVRDITTLDTKINLYKASLTKRNSLSLNTATLLDNLPSGVTLERYQLTSDSAQVSFLATDPLQASFYIASLLEESDVVYSIVLNSASYVPKTNQFVTELEINFGSPPVGNPDA